MTHIFITFCFAVILVSCQKIEGVGGTSTITGKVIMQEIDNQGNVFQEYGAMKEDVFIIYGSDSTYSDNMNTHYDGSFRFQYLYQGQYTLYTYSECQLCFGQLEPILVTVEIAGNRNSVEAPVIYIKKYL